MDRVSSCSSSTIEQGGAGAQEEVRGREEDKPAASLQYITLTRCPRASYDVDQADATLVMRTDADSTNVEKGNGFRHNAVDFAGICIRTPEPAAGRTQGRSNLHVCKARLNKFSAESDSDSDSELPADSSRPSVRSFVQ